MVATNVRVRDLLTVNGDSVLDDTADALNAKIVDATGTAVTMGPAGAGSGPITQVTTSTSSASAVAARAGRRSVFFRNRDTTDGVYISNAATCTSANSILLNPGESIRLYTTVAYTCLATANTPVLEVEEEY